ncbi:MAG: hypothetical protein IIU86_03900 [Oscillospiraceae bacterium]|nr:hypothetical protein [Oscillospiraceae bacterium]
MQAFNFAINKKIMQIVVNSDLFDTSYYGHTRIKRVDSPLFLYMDDDSVLRLFGKSISLVSEKDKLLFQDDVEVDCHPEDATNAFSVLIGHTILDVSLVSDPICEPEELAFRDEQPTELFIRLDKGLTLICSSFLGEFSDIEFSQI